VSVHLVDTFEQWKDAFRQLQDEVDIAFVLYSSSVADWDAEAASRFAVNQARAPIGCWDGYLIEYALLGLTKDPTEQGQWAAQTARLVLDGVPIRSIPIAHNKRAKMYLNMAMARRLGIVFPPEWVQQAELRGERPQRILFVNSYHAGYAWSDAIEQAFCETLSLHPEDIAAEEVNSRQYRVRFVRLESVRQPDEDGLAERVDRVKAMIADWDPDLVVTSDDVAARDVAASQAGTDTPVLFCGVNWDASVYGLPATNVKGMVEVDAIEAAIGLVAPHAKGARIGYLGPDSVSARKTREAYRKHVGLEFASIHSVRDVASWNAAFIKLQDEVDMIFLGAPSGIAGWQTEAQRAFVAAHIRVPTCTTLEMMMPCAIAGTPRVPAEQGWWCGKQAEAILSGEKTIAEVEPTKNTGRRLLLNPSLAARLGIVFDAALIDGATLTPDPQVTAVDEGRRSLR
jgi:ABC-type uncharacterized transport system substrate-binding protein